MFFAEFPEVEYEDSIVKDLSIALILKDDVKNNKDLFFWYELEEGETPEGVAFDFYGSTFFNFIVLLLNDIVDPFFDWPLTYHELHELCVHKYGEPAVTNNVYNDEGFNEIHHWRMNNINYQNDPDTNEPIVPEGVSWETAVPVTNKEYEDDENQKKRRIKILYPELIKNVKRELDILING